MAGNARDQSIEKAIEVSRGLPNHSLMYVVMRLVILRAIPLAL